MVFVLKTEIQIIRKEVKVKKFIALSIMLALFPAVFMTGCTGSTPTGSSNNGGPTATPTATPIPGIYLTPQTTPQAQVSLLTAANYVILSYTGITNSGPSTTCGGYGVYPDGLTSVTGSPAIVENCGGAIDVGDATADQAKKDLGTAYTNIGNRVGGAPIPSGADIGGTTLYPGLYIDNGDLNISSSDLTLDAQGDSTAIFIFKVSGVLTVATSRKVTLANNANAANVYWWLTKNCTLNASVQMKGTIMAYTSVTFGNSTVLTGRALAENGDVTLLTNTITHP